MGSLKERLAGQSDLRASWSQVKAALTLSAHDQPRLLLSPLLQREGEVMCPGSPGREWQSSELNSVSTSSECHLLLLVLVLVMVFTVLHRHHSDPGGHHLHQPFLLAGDKRAQNTLKKGPPAHRETLAGTSPIKHG